MRFTIPTPWLSVVSRVLTVLFGLALLVVTIAWLSGMFTSKVPPGRSSRMDCGSAGSRRTWSTR